MSAPTSSNRLEVCLWIGALALLRALSIVALSDIFFWGEELEKGAAAKALLDGIDVAHHRLAYHYYEGGGFAISHLNALLFSVVGENLLAIRLSGLLTCLLVFCAFWRLIDYHFGRRAARCGALLFLFGPGSFQRYSLLSLGIHFEAMVFGLFILDQGLRLVVDRNREVSTRSLVGLGVVSGLGLFFSYQNLLPICWSGLLVLLFRHRLLLGKRGLAAIAGLLVGLAPLLYMASHVGGALFDIHGQSLGDVGGMERIRAFLGSVYGDTTPWELVCRVLYPVGALGAVLLALFTLEAAPRRTFLGLLGFALLWLTAWAFGPFLDGQLIGWFTWLRMAPLTLCLMLLGAAAVAGPSSMVLRGFFAVLLSLGLVDTGRIILEGRPGTPLRNLEFLQKTKGYDYRGYFPMLLGHLDSLDSRDVAPLLEFNEPDRAFLRTSLAITLFENRRRSINVMDQLSLLEGLDPKGKDDFLLGLGASVLVRAGGDVAAALTQLEGLSGPMGERLAEGVAYFPGHRFETKERLLDDLAVHGRGPMGKSYTRGLGMRAFRNLVVSTMGQELTMDDEGVRRLLARQDQDLALLLLEGYGIERERWTLP